VTPGNEELLRVLMSLVVTVPSTAAVIVLDEKRLVGAELERAWPPQSRDSAIFTLLNMGLPQLSVWIHFIRTRRSLRGAAIGLMWALGITLCDVGAQLAALATVDWLGL
jgi:hypothetical protein